MSRVHTNQSSQRKDRAMRRHILRAATVAMLTLAGTASSRLALLADTVTASEGQAANRQHRLAGQR